MGGLTTPPQAARPHELKQALCKDFSHGTLDGRGNLSEAALVDWIDDVLDVCLDPIQFMQSLLSLDGMGRRIAACLTVEPKTLRSVVRVDALRLLHYLFLVGRQISCSGAPGLTST